MKKAPIFFSLAAIVSILATGCSLQSQNVYPYTFNTAHLEFEVSGMVKGTNSVYIKGDKSVSEFHGTQKDGSKVDSLFINGGEKLYQVDLNTKSGTTAQNPVYSELQKVTKEERMNHLIRSATGNAEMEAGKMPTPKEEKEFAGQKCQLYDVLKVGEVCLWNGLPIYSKVSIPDAGVENTSTAIKIETNIDVPDSKFNIPEGVQLQEAQKAQEATEQ